MTKLISKASPLAKLKARWSAEDYPGGSHRFQLRLFLKDLGIFVGIPVVAMILLKVVEGSSAGSRPKRAAYIRKDVESAFAGSQIIRFTQSARPGSGRRSGGRPAGSLVKAKLLNNVETYGSAPVHAQIVDYTLGREFFGATLIGDAASDPVSGRVSIEFRLVNNGGSRATPISARALSLDGTYGLLAKKKEGFFARAVTRSAASSSIGDPGSGEENLKTIIARMVAGGIVQEFKTSAAEEASRTQVLTVSPSTEFLVELTDDFASVK